MFWSRVLYGTLQGTRSMPSLDQNLPGMSKQSCPPVKYLVYRPGTRFFLVFARAPGANHRCQPSPFFFFCRAANVPPTSQRARPSAAAAAAAEGGGGREGGAGGAERLFTTQVARAAAATTATSSEGWGEERPPFGGRRVPYASAAAAAAVATAAVAAMAMGSLLSGDVEARGDTHVTGNSNIGSSDATSDAARSGGKSPELGGLREIDAGVSDSGGIHGSGGCNHGESAGAAAVGGSLPVGLSDPGRVGREMDG